MKAVSLVAAAQSDALLREIEQQASEEGSALLATAEGQASAMVAQAYRSARLRMRDAIAELRREAASLKSRAKAQAETEAHLRAQKRAAEAISRAWPQLIDALIARWQDPAARRAWFTAAARQAREQMRGEAWRVEHPVDWNADEQREFRAALGIAEEAVIFTQDRDVAAGIRIRAMQATLDATAHGLIADRPAISALLLAEIAQPNGNAGAAIARASR
jgi:hypothetical protein